MPHVCSLYKSRDEFSSQNYKPISLPPPPPAELKILGEIAHHKLAVFLADHPNIAGLPPEQFAYRSHHNCEDAVALAIDEWNRALDNDECCGVVF